jgi:4-amino-4-deoxy-L-arabinose transferase-like glycosyltransferase
MLFVLALVVRLAFCWLVYPLLASRLGTGDDYDVIARALVGGEGYRLDGVDARPERLPLAVLFFAAHFRLFGTASWPWQISQAGLGALSCVLVYRLGKRIGAPGGARLVGLFCALHPALLLYTARPMTETLYVFLMTAFLWALGEQRSALAGVTLGLQWLAKSTAAIGMPAMLGLHRRWPAMIAAPVVLLPWGILNLVQLGTPWLLTATGGRALYHGLYISRHAGWTTPAGDLNRDAELALRGELAERGVAASATVIERDRLAGRLAGDWIRAYPLAYTRLTLRNLVLTWYLGRSGASMIVYALLHAGLLSAAALGARRAWQSHPAERGWLVAALWLIASYTFVHAALHPALRYVLPVVPCATALAAAAWPRQTDRT